VKSHAAVLGIKRKK